MCNKDLSKELYNKYFSLSNNEIEVTLRNKKTLKGKIVGYFKSGNESNNPYISKWHIINTNSFLCIDAFGFLEGNIITHKEISSIYFFDDKSTIIY